jgi:PKD repeat protein
MSVDSGKIGRWVALTIIIVSIGVIGYQLWKYMQTPPTLSFDYNQSVRVGEELVFTNTSSHIDESGIWTWDFGDQSPAVSDFHATHTYPSTGTFIVTLSCRLGDETYVKKGAVVVSLPFPEASFEIDGGEYSVEDSIAITNTSANAVDYIWQFGDGRTSVQFEPELSYTDAGSYELRLIAVNEIGQLNEYSTNITINQSQSNPAGGTDEVLIKHIPVFDEQSLSKALTDLANNELSRADKRSIRNDILKDVSSLSIMVNDMSLENYLNKIQLEASSRKVEIIVTRIDRNAYNKISGININ